MYVCMRMCVGKFMCVCLTVYAYMYSCVHVCVCN